LESPLQADGDQGEASGRDSEAKQAFTEAPMLVIRRVLQRHLSPPRAGTVSRRSIHSKDNA
jgi:hypothetical protein